ncbi:MAG: hypothetical protein ACK5LO_02695 [Leucobacter sp.]
MSKTISVTEIFRDPARAAKRFERGTALVITEEDATWLARRLRSVDLTRGRFGVLREAAETVSAGKTATFSNGFLQEVGASVEVDDDVQTQVAPPVAIGVVVGAAVAGFAIGFGIAWWNSGSGGGKWSKKSTVIINSGGKSKVKVESGGSGEPPREPDEPGDNAQPGGN